MDVAVDIPVIDNPVIDNPVIDDPVIDNPVIDNPDIDNLGDQEPAIAGHQAMMVIRLLLPVLSVPKIEIGNISPKIITETVL